MASYNHVTLLGHVGRVDVKTFESGNRIAEISLATSKRWKDRNGEAHEDTNWHHLVVNGLLVDIVEKYVAKGDPLLVDGEIVYRKFAARDGSERTVADIRVQSLQLLGGRKEEAPTRPAAPVPAPAPAPSESLEPQEDDLPF